jgi:hypothetical protein
MLSSPITLTNLSAWITNPLGLPLSTTRVSSDFAGDGYNFAWNFATETSGVHTVTLNADEFMSPFARFVLAATARIYLPLIFRNF